MMKYLQEKYALSEQGAKDLLKGIVYSFLAYISSWAQSQILCKLKTAVQIGQNIQQAAAARVDAALFTT